MTNPYPIEALLRPPVELYTGYSHLCAAGIAAAAPWALMMPPSLGWATALCFGALGCARVQQGLRIVRYHRNLKRMPRFELAPKQIPVSKARLFLGRGFEWRQKHTQRLHDTRRPAAEPYLKPSNAYRWARRKEAEWERLWLLNQVATALGKDAWWNPVKPLPPVGGNPVLHAVEWEEENVSLPLHERVGHTLVLGTTRVGKTRLMEILVTQDIHRGDTVIAFDPKGDADLMLRMAAECERAGREFIIFHLGFPEISARYNGVGSFSRITEVATRMANQLSGEGNSAAFREFAWRFSNNVARALVSLGQRPTYELIARYVSNIEPLFQDYCRYFLSRPEFITHMRRTAPQWNAVGWEHDIAQREGEINEKNMPFNLKSRQKRTVAMLNFLKDNRIFDPVLDGLRGAVEYDKTYFDKLVASLLPLLEKLTTGQVAELISPDYGNLDDGRLLFDWKSVIARNAVVYVGLDALTDAEVAGATGNSMFADLTSLAGYMYKHGAEHGVIGASKKPARVSLHADEVNELMGPEFIPMVNKAGGAGFQVTAYTQTLSDIEAKVGSRAKAGQVQGNFNNLIMLRVKEQATAEYLTRQLPKVEVNFLVQVSGVSDKEDGRFTSKNDDHISTQVVSMLEPSDIMQLPKGQAFALMEGGRLWKLRMPLPSKQHDPLMPASLEEVAQRMRAKYSTGENWWGEANAGYVHALARDVPLPPEARGGGNADPDDDAQGGSTSTAGPALAGGRYDAMIN